MKISNIFKVSRWAEQESFLPWKEFRFTFSHLFYFSSIFSVTLLSLFILSCFCIVINIRLLLTGTHQRQQDCPRTCCCSTALRPRTCLAFYHRASRSLLQKPLPQATCLEKVSSLFLISSLSSRPAENLFHFI